MIEKILEELRRLEEEEKRKKQPQAQEQKDFEQDMQAVLTILNNLTERVLNLESVVGTASEAINRSDEKFTLLVRAMRMLSEEVKSLSARVEMVSGLDVGKGLSEIKNRVDLHEEKMRAYEKVFENMVGLLKSIAVRIESMERALAERLFQQVQEKERTGAERMQESEKVSQNIETPQVVEEVEIDENAFRGRVI